MVQDFCYLWQSSCGFISLYRARGWMMGRTDELLAVLRAISGPPASIHCGSQSTSHLQERLARWLLMVFDRVDFDNYRVTHDALASVIGERRPGVTRALHDLEGEGLIRCKRNEINIVDPTGLREAAVGRQWDRGRQGFRTYALLLPRPQGDKLLHDPEGGEFGSLEAARADAEEASCEMFSERIPGKEVLDADGFEITTEDGEVMARLPFRVLNLDRGLPAEE